MKTTTYSIVFYILTLVLISRVGVSAQDISGEWTGENSIGDAYVLNIIQNNNNIKGKYKVERKTWLKTYFVEQTFETTVNNNVFLIPLNNQTNTNAASLCASEGFFTYTCEGVYEYLKGDFKILSPNTTCRDYTIQYKRQRYKPCANTVNNSVLPVALQQPNDCCTDPTNIKIESIDENNATISWDMQANAVNYTVFYRAKDEAKWAEITTTARNNGVKLHRLPASTFFEVKVKTNCKENATPVINFATKAPKSNCYAVRNITIEDIDEHNATVHWGAVPDALSYTFFYRNTTADKWITITTKDKNTGVKLHNLPENTNFECKVQTTCTTDSPTSDIEYFTTAETQTKPINDQIADKIQRTVDIKQTVTVKSKKIRISVWDKQKEDGDIISLYLNNDKIVDSLLLKTQKKEYIIDLTEQQNLLTLFAHTTGTEGPNTAAILIEDGYSAQTFILNATLNQSEAMWINR